MTMGINELAAVAWLSARNVSTAVDALGVLALSLARRMDDPTTPVRTARVRDLLEQAQTSRADMSGAAT